MVFSNTTAGQANVMVQNCILHGLGWFGDTQATRDTFMFVTVGTKLDMFVKVINTSFTNNQAPQHTQTELTELFSDMYGQLNTIGLS